MFSLLEIHKLAQELNAKETLMVHIEEEWGKTYDEYKQLEKECNVKFAHDGMKIRI